MTVELLQTLSLASYISAGILLLVGIALFFLLDVPRLYGDISGRTARKAIEAIRQQNESTGNKAYKPSTVNAERGKLTDKITPSGRLQSHTAGLPVGVSTEKFDTDALQPASSETTVLTAPADETTVLSATLPTESGETTLLVNAESQAVTTSDDGFTVEVEIAFTGSSEIIE